jgi:hypothetical protein
VQPEIADEMPRGRKPAHVADHGGQRGRGHDVDAGDRHEPAHVVVAERVLGDDRADPRELAGQEVQLAQPAVDGESLIGGGSCRAAIHARPFLPNGSLAGLRPLWVAMQRGGDLVC